jgi:leader peptidase (prepilin peptidase) / N-methyltransferase
LTAIIIIILAVLGAALGSFFNVLIYRLPRKESIVFPASHCGECGKPIPFYLNVPIISYILLKGKCKYCSAKIHWHHLLVEIITPLILIGVFLQYGFFNVLFIKYALLALWMIPIFFIDGFHQIIPHKLSIPLIPIGLIFALVPQNDVGIVSSLLAAVIIFSFLLLLAYLYRFARKADGLGGGDILLLTGISTFFGLISLPFLVLFASLLGIFYFLIFVRDKEKGFAFGTFISFSVVFWILMGGERLLYYLPY